MYAATADDVLPALAQLALVEEVDELAGWLVGEGATTASVTDSAFVVVIETTRVVASTCGMIGPSGVVVTVTAGAACVSVCAGCDTLTVSYTVVPSSVLEGPPTSTTE